MGQLDGKIALITGTARGMGRASAMLFAAAGAKVVGCDLNLAESEDTVREVRAAGGEMAAMAPVDLGDAESCKRWVDDAAAVYGGIDILFNNASSPRVGRFDAMSLDDWYYTIRNELDLVFLATRFAWPHLIARGGGVVLNMASVSAIRGASFQQQAAHGAAKGGVLSFTYHIAAAGAPHKIRANAILPGLIRTPSTEFLFEHEDSPGSMLGKANPLGRAG